MSGDSISNGVSSVSPLASHYGLSAQEITLDCLEKAKSLLAGLVAATTQELRDVWIHHQLTLIDDLISLAITAHQQDDH